MYIYIYVYIYIYIFTFTHTHTHRLYFQILKNSQKLEQLSNQGGGEGWEGGDEHELTLDDVAQKIGHERWFSISYDVKNGLRKKCQVGW